MPLAVLFILDLSHAPDAREGATKSVIIGHLFVLEGPHNAEILEHRQELRRALIISLFLEDLLQVVNGLNVIFVSPTDRLFVNEHQKRIAERLKVIRSTLCIPFKGFY